MNVTDCQFTCDDRSGCYSLHEICDRIRHCLDFSDEKLCGRILCKNRFAHEPYFKCVDGNCIHRNLLNDGARDCKDGSDEGSGTAYFTFLLVLLFLGYFLILTRWILTRRDMGHLLQNMPEFPLPPFRAPGERSECEISDSELQSGGEVFESFAQNRRLLERQTKTKSSRRSYKERHIKSIDPSEVDDSLVALASLSLDLNSCIGLNREALKNNPDVPSCSGGDKKCLTTRSEFAMAMEKNVFPTISERYLKRTSTSTTSSSEKDPYVKAAEEEIKRYSYGDLMCAEMSKPSPAEVWGVIMKERNQDCISNDESVKYVECTQVYSFRESFTRHSADMYMELRKRDLCREKCKSATAVKENEESQDGPPANPGGSRSAHAVVQRMVSDNLILVKESTVKVHPSKSLKVCVQLEKEPDDAKRVRSDETYTARKCAEVDSRLIKSSVRL